MSDNRPTPRTDAKQNAFNDRDASYDLDDIIDASVALLALAMKVKDDLRAELEAANKVAYQWQEAGKDLSAQLTALTAANAKLRETLETTKSNEERLMQKVCDIVKLVHDRFHEVGQFRDPNAQLFGE